MNKTKKQSKKSIVSTEPVKTTPPAVELAKSPVAKPQPVKAVVVKPEPVRAAPAVVETAKSMVAKPQTPKLEAIKPEPVTAEAAKPVSAKPEPLKPNPMKVETAQAPARLPNRVSLGLVRPGAKQVFVAGSFNGWKPEQTPLVPKGNGLWVGDLAVPPGRHEYLFVVDGQWVLDPNAKETVQNPFGGKNGVLRVAN